MMKSGRSGSFTAFNGPLMRVARGIKNLPFVAHALNGRANAKVVQKESNVFLKKVEDKTLKEIQKFYFCCSRSQWQGKGKDSAKNPA